MRGTDEPIAVVGLAGLLPGSDDVEEFWLNLLRGHDPDTGRRWRAAASEEPESRLLAEIAHAAVENAGYDPARLPGRIGLFTAPRPGPGPSALEAVGLAAGVAACHTGGLAALHLACRSLQAGDCDTALVVGLDIDGPVAGPDPLDADGGATVAGVACAVLLKRAADAGRDGDHVRALVRTGPRDAAVAGDVRVDAVRGGVGHHGPASEIAGFVATVLALERELLPPDVDPADRSRGPSHGVESWPREPSRPRRASVGSTCGAGVHVEVEEGPERRLCAHAGRPRIVVWSAHEPDTERDVRARLAQFFVWRGEEVFTDAVATLQNGRRGQRYRAAAVCTGARDAAAVLGARASARVLTSAPAPSRPVCLLFPGSGRLRWQAVDELGRAFPVFARAVDSWLRRFERAGLPVGSVDGGAAGTVGGTGGAVGAALLFAVEAGLARLWLSAGVRPAALIGDGIGGLVAAVVAELISPADAVRLVARGAETARLTAVTPAVPVHLTSTARGVGGEAPLWTRQAAGAARLAETLDAVRAELGPAVLVEAGPGGTPAERTGGLAVVPSVASGDGDEPVDVAVLTAAARLWTDGHDLRWDALGQPALRRRVALPAHPYRRERRWRGLSEPGPVRRDAATAAALVGTAPHPVDTAIAIDALGPEGTGPTVVTLNYAGGSSRAFRPLRRFLPPECLLALADLPGHGRRLGGECLRDADVAVSELAVALRTLPVGRLVLVGYSLGGVLAYELAARLAERGTPPDGLVVCGTRAPHTGVGHPPVAHLPSGEPFLRAAFDRGLAAREMVEIPELAEAFAPPLHADLAMVESFRYRPRAPLPVPVCVIGFRSDWLVPEPSLRAWDTVCREPPRHVRLDGGHLAIHDREAEFAAAVGAAVEHLLDVGARPGSPLYGTPTGTGASPTVDGGRLGRRQDTPQPRGGGR